MTFQINIETTLLGYSMSVEEDIRILRKIEKKGARCADGVMATRIPLAETARIFRV